MKRVPLVKSVMTPFPYSIDVDDTVENAAKMMLEHGIRDLPVTDEGKPIGVVTDRDVRRTLASYSDKASGEGLPRGRVPSPRVQQIANLDVCIVDLGAPLDGVIMEMARRHTTTTLVVREGRLVGVFSAGEAFRYLGKILGVLFPRGRGDAA